MPGYSSGANAYVRKPVKFSAFAEAVNAIGVFWLFLSEPMPDDFSPARPAAGDALNLAPIPPEEASIVAGGQDG